MSLSSKTLSRLSAGIDFYIQPLQRSRIGFTCVMRAKRGSRVSLSPACDRQHLSQSHSYAFERSLRSNE